MKLNAKNCHYYSTYTIENLHFTATIMMVVTITSIDIKQVFLEIAFNHIIN